MSPYDMIPSIIISPPTSSREGTFPKHRTSSELATIEESEHFANCLRKRPTNLPSPGNFLSPHGHMSPRSECNGDERSSGSDGELDKLKSMATRLKLRTRRPSYVEWCENLPKLRDLNCTSKEGHYGNEDWRSFKERRENLEEKIQWVRKELIEMKSQDHRLAIQLMRLRSEIQQLKLQASCREHRELIDTATECAHEDRDSQQQPALCDPPFRGSGLFFALEKPLKDFGVTRFNLFTRRFSLC